MSFEQDGSAALRIVESVKKRGLFPLLDDVCRRHAVTPTEVCGRGRTKNIVKARHEVWWRLRNRRVSTFSYPEIGRLFQCDHTTIMAATRAFDRAHPPITAAPPTTLRVRVASTIGGSACSTPESHSPLEISTIARQSERRVHAA